MSLVNPQNFLAPFRQKFHLITIILIIAVFLVLRFSGAQVNVESVGRHQAALPSANQSLSRKLNVPQHLVVPSVSGTEAKLDPLDPFQETRRLVGNSGNAKSLLPQKGTFRIQQDNQGRPIEEVLLPNGQLAASANQQKTKVDQQADNGSLSEIEKQLGLK